MEQHLRPGMRVRHGKHHGHITTIRPLTISLDTAHGERDEVVVKVSELAVLHSVPHVRVLGTAMAVARASVGVAGDSLESVWEAELAAGEGVGYLRYVDELCIAADRAEDAA